jgi:hypothetical protein
MDKNKWTASPARMRAEEIHPGVGKEYHIKDMEASDERNSLIEIKEEILSDNMKDADS